MPPYHKYNVDNRRLVWAEDEQQARAIAAVAANVPVVQVAANFRLPHPVPPPAAAAAPNHGGLRRFLVDGAETWAADATAVRANLHFVVNDPRTITAVDDTVDQTAGQWNVYLVGHGYSLYNYGAIPPNSHVPRPRTTFTVPVGIPRVNFYCAEGEMIGGNREQHRIMGSEDPPMAVVEHYDANTDHNQHLLVFPSTDLEGVALGSMVQIRKVGFHPNDNNMLLLPDSAPLVFSSNPPFLDGCMIYVGTSVLRPAIVGPHVNVRNIKGHCLGNYAALSDILELIQRHHQPTIVHWVACRGEIYATDQDDGLDFYAQCRGFVGMMQGDTESFRPTLVQFATF